MTFRTRLTLLFTLLVAAVFSIMSLVVYFFAERYTTSDFYERLQDRAYTTAHVYLEEDELSTSSYKKVLRRYQRTLSDEQIYIYGKDRRPAFESDPVRLARPEVVFNKLEKQKYTAFREGDRQWVGLQYDDNQGQFYVLVTARDRSGLSKLENLRHILTICFAACTGLVWVLGWFFSRQVLRPIARIVHEVNQLKASNLHHRLHQPTGKDEISALTRTFNQMLDRLEVSFEMQKNFISNASHELRNPLTAISGEIEVTLLRRRAPEEYITSLKTLQQETERLERLTSDLLNLAQAGFEESDIRREAVRLDELLLETIAEVRRTHPSCQVALNLDAMPRQPEALELTGNPALLKIAFGNVLDNACKFSGGHSIQVKLQQENGVTITITDQGIGIPQNELQHIFQPFYRARNARGHSGTGIGLSLTEKIIRLHNGSITASSAEGQGTTLQVQFKV